MNNDITIEDLYNGAATIEVKMTHHAAPYSVEMTKSELNIKTMEFEDTPDCKVGSWTDNRWFRTEKGAWREKYASLRSLKGAITNAAKQRGMEVEKYIIKRVEVAA